MSLLLLLKLFLAPFFVALLGYIQRRWGDGIGGRLIGLPITTGPFIFIIYIQEGAPFAARAAHGVLVGQVALMVFSWVYAMAALRMSWGRALATGSAAYLLAGMVLTSFEIRDSCSYSHTHWCSLHTRPSSGWSTLHLSSHYFRAWSLQSAKTRPQFNRGHPPWAHAIPSHNNRNHDDIGGNSLKDA